MGDSASAGLASSANKPTPNGSTIQDGSDIEAVPTHPAHQADADHFVKRTGGV